MPRRLKGDPEVADKVLSLRRAGVQFDAIAERLNLTVTAAKALFDQALAAHDPVFQRSLEADRLDRLHAAVWSQAIKGDLEAVDRVVRISERREHVAIVPKVNEHSLREAFDLAASSSDDLHDDMDAALIAAGRKIADRVDEAVATGEGIEVTKALYLVPHMLNVLREMCATPLSRKATQDAVPPTPAGKLAELRAVNGGAGKTGS